MPLNRIEVKSESNEFGELMKRKGRFTKSFEKGNSAVLAIEYFFKTLTYNFAYPVI